MARIHLPKLDEFAVLQQWAILCAKHKEFFAKYSHATKCANVASMNKNSEDIPLIYGQVCGDFDKIGSWCLDFLDYVEGENPTDDAFKMIHDIAQWWIEGDDQ